MPSRPRRTKNLTSVIEESKERAMDDTSLSRKDRSLTLDHKKGFSTFIDEKSKFESELKRSDNTEKFLIKIESADDTRVLDGRRKQTQRTRNTDQNIEEDTKPKLISSLSANNLVENTEKLIINIETGNNSELNNNCIGTNSHNTNVYVEEGCEDDQHKFLKPLKGSKIITHTKALDKDDDFPGLMTDPKDKKLKKKRSINFQNFRLVTNKSLTLCNDIMELITLQKFNLIIDSYAKIKICKFALEKITMPQFRNVKMNNEKREEIISNTLQNMNNGDIPDSGDNKRIIFFVVFLVLIFAGLVAFILFK